MNTVISEIHKVLNSPSPIKLENKSTERKEGNKFAEAFPKIKRERRKGFIVDKSVSTKLKMK